MTSLDELVESQGAQGATVRGLEDRMILFIVKWGNAHVLTWAYDREDAKRKARSWLYYDPDQYIVTPLTKPGDRIHLSITLSV